MSDSVIASGTVAQSRRVVIDLPENVTGALSLRLSPPNGQRGTGALKYFLRGDGDVLYRKAAGVAREAV